MFSENCENGNVQVGSAIEGTSESRLESLASVLRRASLDGTINPGSIRREFYELAKIVQMRMDNIWTIKAEATGAGSYFDNLMEQSFYRTIHRDACDGSLEFSSVESLAALAEKMFDDSMDGRFPDVFMRKAFRELGKIVLDVAHAQDNWYAPIRQGDN